MWDFDGREVETTVVISGEIVVSCQTQSVEGEDKRVLGKRYQEFSYYREFCFESEKEPQTFRRHYVGVGEGGYFVSRRE